VREDGARIGLRATVCSPSRSLFCGHIVKQKIKPFSSQSAWLRISYELTNESGDIMKMLLILPAAGLVRAKAFICRSGPAKGETYERR